jgi:hypothetical protein
VFIDCVWRDRSRRQFSTFLGRKRGGGGLYQLQIRDRRVTGPAGRHP